MLGLDMGFFIAGVVVVRKVLVVPESEIADSFFESVGKLHYFLAVKAILLQGYNKYLGLDFRLKSGSLLQLASGNQNPLSS